MELDIRFLVMISPQLFLQCLNKQSIKFYAGVPDSLLQHFCNYITEHVSSDNHIVCANEGGAIGLATGYHLATKEIGLVYMQNSGLGNAINPLLSIADKEAYSIPMLLLIGWRGEPGTDDEPQHRKQGRCTIPLLQVMEIPHQILPDNSESAEKVIHAAVDHMRKESEPFAIIVKRGTFLPYRLKEEQDSVYPSREHVIRLIVDSLETEDLLCATTGMIAREVFDYRKQSGHDHKRDFLCVGGMGHVSQLALGVASRKTNSKVFCLDGDGSVIMHMGSLAINGAQKLQNFIHIILNNGCHDSVGGQPTVGWNLKFVEIAHAVGYNKVLYATSFADIERSLAVLRTSQGPCFLEIRVKKGHRESLGRPTKGLVQMKTAFMKF